MKRRCFSFLIIAVVFTSGIHAITYQQLRSSGNIIRRTCVSKTKIDEDTAKNIEKGMFIEDREFMCYIACVFKLIQIVKNNKLNLEASLQHIDRMYPTNMQEVAKQSILNCREPTKIKDLCEASYWTAKCMYEYCPEEFFFP